MGSPYDPRLRETLVSSFDRKDHPLGAPQISALLAYLSLLDKWNRRVRLTGLRDPVEIASRLLPESLDFLRLWSPRAGERALDVGAGAGIVAIPIGVLFPQVEMVLVESQGRKASFLREAVRAVVGAMGAGNFRVINQRVETLWEGKKTKDGEKGGRHLGGFQAILCRAVAPVSELLPKVWPLLADGGRLLIRQGVRGEAELETARAAMTSLGCFLLGVTGLEGGRIIALGPER